MFTCCVGYYHTSTSPRSFRDFLVSSSLCDKIPTICTVLVKRQLSNMEDRQEKVPTDLEIETNLKNAKAFIKAVSTIAIITAAISAILSVLTAFSLINEQAKVIVSIVVLVLNMFNSLVPKLAEIWGQVDKVEKNAKAIGVKECVTTDAYQALLAELVTRSTATATPVAEANIISDFSTRALHDYKLHLFT